MGHIGLYDSGIGGLTVLKALVAKYPTHRYTYFGDNKYAPYGSKTADVLWERNQYILDFLLAKGVDHIVIACNTSTALFLDKIRRHVGENITVTSIIAPACKAAVIATKRNCIGVLATEQTIKSKIYSRSILEIDTKQSVIEIACPELVPLIEAGEINNPVHFETLTKGLRSAVDHGCDTIIYGCTHYPLLNMLWKSILNHKEILINPADTVSINDTPLLEFSKASTPIPIYCSGIKRPFEEMSKDYLTETDVEILSMPH